LGDLKHQVRDASLELKIGFSFSGGPLI
jgi:hypothetical protein